MDSLSAAIGFLFARLSATSDGPICHTPQPTPPIDDDDDEDEEDEGDEDGQEEPAVIREPDE